MCTARTPRTARTCCGAARSPRTGQAGLPALPVHQDAEHQDAVSSASATIPVARLAYQSAVFIRILT